MTNTNTPARIPAYLPFDGGPSDSYIGFWIEEAEDAERFSAIEYVEERFGISDDVACRIWDETFPRGMDCRAAKKALTRAWIDRYVSLFKEETDIDLGAAFSRVIPDTFGFYGESLEVSIPVDALRAVRKAAEGPEFAAEIAEAMRPRSGFAPLHSQDVRDWGPVGTWSPAQIELLLSHFVDFRAVFDADDGTMTDVARDELHSDAFYRACETYAKSAC